MLVKKYKKAKNKIKNKKKEKFANHVQPKRCFSFDLPS